MRLFAAFLLSLLTVFAPIKNQSPSIDFGNLFDNHQTVMLIIEPETGSIFYANEAAATFYGYPLDVLLTMNIDQINTLSDDEIAAEMQQAVLEQRNFFVFKHQLANGEIRTVHVYSYPVEIEGVTYLYSIVIDQTAFATAQLRNTILFYSIIGLLLLFGVTVTVSFYRQRNAHARVAAASATIAEEQRMKSMMLDNVPGVVYRCLDDESWTMLFMSEKIRDLTGYSAKDFYDGVITYNDVILPEDRPRVRQQFSTGFAQQTAVTLLYNIKHQDGSVRIVHEVAQYIHQKDASGCEIIEGFIQDVTASKLAERKVSYYHDFLNYIITSSNQGVAVHDKDLRYVYVSKKYLEIYRIEQSNVIGRHHYDVFPDLPEKWREVHRRCLNGEVLSGEHDEFPRADGTIDYTRWLCRPWYDETGAIGGIIVYTEVINDLVKTEMELKASRDQLQLVMDNLPIGIAVNSVNPSVSFAYMNDNFSKIYCVDKESITHDDAFWDAVYEDETFRETIKQRVLADIASGDHSRMKWEDVPITRAGKIVRYISAYATPIPNTNLLISTVIDVTEQKIKENEIVYTSNHDYLTELPNRRYFEATLAQWDQKANYPLAIGMLDLDGLKLINDAFGHDKGNIALKMVAKLLERVKRDQDFIARVGGDEFIMLCPNTDETTAGTIRQQLFDLSHDLAIDELKFSISVGFAIKHDETIDTDELLKEAENMMYSNKVLHGQSVRNESVMTILTALKDKYEEERLHSDNVSRYCRLMGEQLNLTRDQIKELELAGLMHDIGKMTIPDVILDKPGKLTPEEWHIMKSHTINGYNILRSADKYSRLAEYALTHHERIDGHGYPNGLKNGEIPLFSRIICIADAFEAMTANRPYRRALHRDVAIKELTRCSGTQFDRELVKVFIEKVLPLDFQ